MPGDLWEYDLRTEHEHPLEALLDPASMALSSGETPVFLHALQQRSEALEREAGPFLLASSAVPEIAGETQRSGAPTATAIDRDSGGAGDAALLVKQGGPRLRNCGCPHPAQEKRTVGEEQEMPAALEAFASVEARGSDLRSGEAEAPLPAYLRMLSRMCERAAERLEQQKRGIAASRVVGLETRISTEPEMFATSVAEWRGASETQGETLAMSATNPGLNVCANAAAGDPAVAELSSMVLDLTDNPASVPFAGHQQDEMLYVASLAKIYPMYAAFRLRRMVETKAKEMIRAGLSTATTGWELTVFAELKKTLQPELQAAFPRLPVNFPALSSMFWISDVGDANFVEQAPMLTDAALDHAGEFGAPPGKFRDWMRLMLRWSNDTAASRVIQALGYSMINFALQSGAFFDRSTGRGLWISGDYRGE